MQRPQSCGSRFHMSEFRGFALSRATVRIPIAIAAHGVLTTLVFLWVARGATLEGTSPTGAQVRAGFCAAGVLVIGIHWFAVKRWKALWISATTLVHRNEAIPLHSASVTMLPRAGGLPRFRIEHGRQVGTRSSRCVHWICPWLHEDPDDLVRILTSLADKRDVITTTEAP